MISFQKQFFMANSVLHFQLEPEPESFTSRPRQRTRISGFKYSLLFAFACCVHPKAQLSDQMLGVLILNENIKKKNVDMRGDFVYFVFSSRRIALRIAAEFSLRLKGAHQVVAAESSANLA